MRLILVRHGQYCSPGSRQGVPVHQSDSIFAFRFRFTRHRIMDEYLRGLQERATFLHAVPRAIWRDAVGVPGVRSGRVIEHRRRPPKPLEIPLPRLAPLILARAGRRADLERAYEPRRGRGHFFDRAVEDLFVRL